jgi:1-acyl-sn-glycerol-3-phosphate acyltransferase
VEEIQAGLRGVVKFIRALGVVIAFLSHGIFLKWKHRQDRLAQRGAYAKNTQHYCQVMARVFGIKILVKGQPVAGTNFLYVGNHMGFVDIFTVSSLFPALFITSQEMRETPLLGVLCEMAGCIFVERRSRVRIKSELNVVADTLREGFNIVLYPEATSSDGEKLLPFKKTLMMSAAHAGLPIQPGVINFLEINGEKFSLKNRDRVCWHGNMSFAKVMWGGLSAKSITAEVEFLEPIYATPDMNRGVVADQAYQQVKSKYIPATGLAPIVTG